MKRGNPQGRALRGAVFVTVMFGLVLPIAAGLWQTGRAAFGLMPALGTHAPSLAPWQALVAVPGIGRALALSLWTGLAATGLSLILALGFCAMVHGRMSTRAGGRVLTPFLAAPHAAVAIGLAFVLAPSGWMARAVAPILGLTQPPDLATVNDPMGLALILGLMVKEVPFLLLVLLTALTQIPLRQQMIAGRALGYGRAMIWAKVILPLVWPLIRMPVLVVLAFSLSVVDMALILGPSNPPTLAVLLTRMFADPDLSRLLPASAGALVQLFLVLAAFAAIWGVEKALRQAGLVWLRRGGRGRGVEPLAMAATLATTVLCVIGTLGLLALALWSLAWRWAWPAVLPQGWSLHAWAAPGNGWLAPLVTTTSIALVATALCLALAVTWLEGEDRAQLARARWAEGLIYLPLLVPQVSFLFGINVLMLQIGVQPGFWAVVWGHCLFVFPYVMLALSDPWRARDRRLDRTAASLGAGPWRRLFRVKLPVLLAPLCAAFAIGIAVSVAQYLPTLFLGAGRVATLTTEAVTLASSSDRRVIGVYASLQAVLPFLAYALAFLIPMVLHANRRDLKGAAGA